jgi:lysine 6-dehydrogenase
LVSILIEACIKTGKNLVDVSYMPENPLVLHDKAVEADVTIVPSCGLAPGISNILVGHAYAELDKTSKVHIMVGGLPETPIPPLGYVITWSPESLIDEYTCKARIIKGWQNSRGRSLGRIGRGGISRDWKAGSVLY